MGERPYDVAWKTLGWQRAPEFTLSSACGSEILDEALNLCGPGFCFKWCYWCRWEINERICERTIHLSCSESHLSSVSIGYFVVFLNRPSQLMWLRSLLTAGLQLALGIELLNIYGNRKPQRWVLKLAMLPLSLVSYLGAKIVVLVGGHCCPKCAL